MYSEDIYPFVRYARRITPATVATLRFPLLAYDHRLFSCANGKSVITVAAQEYHLREGDVLYIPAATEYRYSHMEKDFSLYALNFDLTSRASHKDTPIPPDDTAHFRAENRTEPPPGEPFALPLFVSLPIATQKMALIEEEYRLCRPFYARRLSHLTADLLWETARTALQEEALRTATIVQRITTYIHEHYAEDCGNERIAALFAYHPNYLNRLMQEQTGYTLHRYLTRHRIHQAMTLLSTTDLSVAEIAVRVGIPDLSHFSKTFRRITGYAPIAFRYKI